MFLFFWDVKLQKKPKQKVWVFKYKQVIIII